VPGYTFLTDGGIKPSSSSRDANSASTGSRSAKLRRPDREAERRVHRACMDRRNRL